MSWPLANATSNMLQGVFLFLRIVIMHELDKTILTQLSKLQLHIVAAQFQGLVGSTSSKDNFRKTMHEGSIRMAFAFAQPCCHQLT